MARNRSSGKDCGGQREWAMSRCKVDLILEYSGRLGCNIQVKLSQTVADGGTEGCRTWGGGGMIQKTVDDGGAVNMLGLKNSDTS